MKAIQLNALMIIAALFLSSTQYAHADEHDHSRHVSHANHSGHDHSRPDSHAPIGVMGDHLMREGKHAKLPFYVYGYGRQPNW